MHHERKSTGSISCVFSELDEARLVVPAGERVGNGGRRLRIARMCVCARDSNRLLNQRYDPFSLSLCPTNPPTHKEKEGVKTHTRTHQALHHRDDGAGAGQLQPQAPAALQHILQFNSVGRVVVEVVLF